MSNTTDYTLLVVDVSGIQDYVFDSNKLKHIIGASQLVHEATHGWVQNCLQQTNARHNLTELGQKIETQKRIEKGELDTEVVYVGGGNAVIIFANATLAMQFAQRLSSKVLIEAPGLSLVIKQATFEWQNDSHVTLRPALQEVLEKGLRQKKDHRKPTRGLLGLGVTADCQFTGLPAVTTDPKDDDRRVSAEIAAKIAKRVQDAADARLKSTCDFGAYTPAIDFDAFGTRGESSYVAVVHADGNGVGKRFEKVGEGLPNRDYIEAVRALSQSVNTAGIESLKYATDCLKSNIRKDKDFAGIALSKAGELRLRPILFGGDDTTFICDGRLGLALTRLYLRKFSEYTLSEDPNDRASARAGIAVVKSHYPVARAYQMAEALASKAKERTKDIAIEGKPKPCVMDWHFGVNGVVTELDELRTRDYHDKNGNDLMMRPLQLDNDLHNRRDWNSFESLVAEFSSGDTWRDKRNKVKALRGAVRDGADAVKAFATLNKVALPKIAGTNAHDSGGLIGPRSVYFDALEALDFYVPVQDKSEEAA